MTRKRWLITVLGAGAMVAIMAMPAWASPQAPQNLWAGTVDGSDGHAIYLSWDDPDDNTITGYEWRRRGTLNNTPWAAIEGAVTQHHITGLSLGTTYTIEVRSVHSDGSRSGAARVTYRMDADDVIGTYMSPAVLDDDPAGDDEYEVSVGDPVSRPGTVDPRSAAPVRTAAQVGTTSPTGGRYNFVTVTCHGTSSDPALCVRVRGASPITTRNAETGQLDCVVSDVPVCDTSVARPTSDPCDQSDGTSDDYVCERNDDNVYVPVECRVSSEYCYPHGEVKTGPGSPNDPNRFTKEFCWDDTSTIRTAVPPPAGTPILEQGTRTLMDGTTITWYKWEKTSRVCNVRQSDL